MSIGIGDDIGSLYGETAEREARLEADRRNATPRQRRAEKRELLNREADRLIRHLTRHPDDRAARAKLLETYERLGVAVIR